MLFHLSGEVSDNSFSPAEHFCGVEWNVVQVDYGGIAAIGVMLVWFIS